MIDAFPQAQPLAGFTGGLMIGVAAAVMLLGLGRIAGVSGMAARAAGLAGGSAGRGVATAFILGLPLGAWLIGFAGGGVETQYPASLWTLLIAGVLVGYGARLGSGCTSGHGVCGLSRLSLRSLVATALFMTSAFVTVALMRLGGLS